MRELDESFALLLNRQPTDAERQALYRVRDALALDNNDALWVILMALQYHQSQYEKFPKAIAQAAQDILVDFRVTADATAQASAQAAKADMASAVASTATKVAKQKAGTVKTQWIVACVVVVTGCLGVTGWLAYQAGDNHLWGQGHEKMQVESAAAEWAFTPEGLLAHKLAQAGPGNIKSLANCEGHGWHREKYNDGFACFPKADKKDKQPSGWWVP